MSDPIVLCPACGRPADRVRDPVTGDSRIVCTAAYAPCGEEEIAAALAGRPAAPQVTLFDPEVA